MRLVERYINIIGSIIILGIMYYYLYEVPCANGSYFKSILPLLCAIAGWIIRDNIYCQQTGELGKHLNFPSNEQPGAEFGKSADTPIRQEPLVRED